MNEFEKLKRKALDGRETRVRLILTDRMRNMIDELILTGFHKEEIFNGIDDVMVEEYKRRFVVNGVGQSGMRED